MHVKPGKGAAFVRSKLKSCLTGHTLDKTWRAGETVQVAQVNSVCGQNLRVANKLMLLGHAY